MTTPQPPGPAHLDPDTLADLQAGLLGPADAAAAQRHLDGCAQCGDVHAALDEVRTTLSAAAQTGPMPADVADRLDDALAAAARDATADGGSGGQPDAARTVVPMSSGRRQRRESWHTRLAQAAAVIVLLAAVGGIGYGAFSNGSGGGSTASQDSAAGSAQKGGADRQSESRDYPVSESGRDYTSETLRSSVPALLGGTGTRSGSENRALDGASAGPTGTAPTDAAPTDEGSLARCAQSLAGEPATPLAVDVARFEHQPALVIVLRTPDDPASVDVFAVPPGCPTGQVLQFERVALP